MPNSPNMGLSILTPSITTGPGWATSLESDKLLLDAHTHVSGQGVPVPTAGLNINANLPLGGHNLQHAGTLGLDNQTTTASGVTASIFYAYAGDIYWNNGSAVPVQLTSGSAIAASSIGGITGLAGTSAALTYSQALTTFIATADVGKSAALDAGAVTIRQTNTSSAKGVTLSSPASLGADYTITLPTAVPSRSGVMILSPTGVVTTSEPLATITIGDGVSSFGNINGTTETVFNQAITLLPTGGGRIFVKRGTYTFANQVVISKAGVRIEGETPDSTGLLITGAPVGSGLFEVAADNVQLRNLYLKPTGTTVGLIKVRNGVNYTLVEDCILDGGSASGSSSAGIFMHGSLGAYMRNRILQGTFNSSLPAEGFATNLTGIPVPTTVSGNYIAGNTIFAQNYGWHIIADARTAGATGTVQVVENSFVHNTVNGGPVGGSIQMLSASTNTNAAGQTARVRGNVVMGNTAQSNSSTIPIQTTRSAGSPTGTEVIRANMFAWNIFPAGSAMSYANTESVAGLTASGLNGPLANRTFAASSSGGSPTRQFNDIDWNSTGIA